MPESITIGESVLSADDLAATQNWLRFASDAEINKLQAMFNSISATGRNASNLIEELKARSKKRLANGVNNKL